MTGRKPFSAVNHGLHTVQLAVTVAYCCHHTTSELKSGQQPQSTEFLKSIMPEAQWYYPNICLEEEDELHKQNSQNLNWRAPKYRVVITTPQCLTWVSFST